MEYQVLARKYRPQSFKEVIGQEAIVTTLKNAIKHKRLAHGYLFCGSRGTGKTTLARVFAKALNCLEPTADLEPCNQCASCKEISAGTSLDVLEIDGASHRGIDDIRQINETVSYTAPSGKYKIYIIDEVHMLTKEAFNALLKTLEEPPDKVKFFFATTEPQKVLPTILSRCQRFNLSRIPPEKIIEKLRFIVSELTISIEEEALHLIAKRAEGGLRDAESLLDQIISFHEGAITSESVASVLGVVPRELLFEFDQAILEGRLSFAFEIAYQIFAQGKDLVHFVESLAEHFRNILLVKISHKNSPLLLLSEAERERYDFSSRIYSKEQCMTILDLLVEAQNQIRFALSGRIALEALLLRIMRMHQQIPIEDLVQKLVELEGAVAGAPQTAIITSAPSLPPPPRPKEPERILPSFKEPEKLPRPTPKEPEKPLSSMTVDPTPSSADLGIKPKPVPQPKPASTPAPIQKTPPPQPVSLQQQNRYDTILQFAAIELEGTIQKNS